ncbi:hypothetical protein GIB67_033318 [Kingdonia uniflora]|uniref:snRNA-activating protein complex subunit n=1 Tax=Kingdonia uniflora TaxID=39325 RepID=A0A7J7LTP5_9MAGN|nr:hypothetical protein GIB67_033318 [Kingdonia uniflora]
MEIINCCSSQDEATCNSFPRGGPIYIPNHVGPITRVAEFENLILEELQNLRVDVCVDSSRVCEEDDFSVNELKIFSEEELVDEALRDAFQGDECNESSSQVPVELANCIREDWHLEGSENEVSNLAGTYDEDIPDKLARIDSKKKKKRGRTFDRDTRATELESSYTAKVVELAKIKQNQDRNKAAARLHSFNGSRKIDDGPSSSSGNIAKIKSLKYITSAPKVKPSHVHEHLPVSYPEVVLCVEVYNSRRSWVKIRNSHFEESMSYLCFYELHLQTQEFLVLGMQTLAELKDQIYCLTDQLMQKAGKDDSSGYFFIEDTFCNDVRDPSPIDYSRPILDWLQKSKDEALEKWECILSGELQQKQKAALGNATKAHLPHFKSYRMHEIRFRDLPFRLGAGYLYCHQGDCKHIFVIRDMRLIHPEDVQNRAAYPLLTFQIKLRHRKCSVCNIYRATKVTVDDKWAQENPCYFCDNCYYLLHYNEDGSLLYDDFTVFDYHKD